MAVAAAALAAAALAAPAAGCGGGEDPRPDAAARLVPSDALAYVHVDLDDEHLAEHASKFPSVVRLVEGLSSLAGPAVEEWRGDEAALALLDSGGPAADTLLLVEVDDARAAARAVRDEGGVQAALAGGFLAVGQERVVRRALAIARSGRGGLDRTVEASVDAWIPDEGLRRVLEAQEGLLGAVASALDDPRLRFVALSAEAEAQGVRLTVRRARRGAPPGAAGFEPTLLERVPADATAYVGTASARPLLERLGMGGLAVGELAAWVQSGLPAPVLTAVARVRDEAAARDGVGRALGVLAERLAAAEDPSAGRIAQLEERDLAGGLTASVVPLSPGVELAAAVADDHLLVSTDPAALVRARGEARRQLREADRFEAVVGDLPEKAEAIAFADLAQLLTLGEQVGLTPARAAGAVTNELRRIRALGATAQREGSDTTAEIFFQIP